ncbi:hypothetical protein HBA54_15220 [Pelagibius litoralis]|uniref:Uncharacterized protein n=1 Tax=Pelagibius litoralis TaxID=374515 RepID=A0A967EYW1_9PROT|nr:hypothetical protein [Pelagibius litoralis]NIA69953.1 hypothetical protein [Pelagibius litoralis]
MHLKHLLITTCAAMALGAGAAMADSSVSQPITQIAYDAPVNVSLSFKRHVDDNLAEQDVFIEREAGSGKVYRPTKGDQDLKLPLYAAARQLDHNPFDETAEGPWPKGRPLGLTLGEWLNAKGEARYSCQDGAGTLTADFSGLIPDGVYTMWHFFMASPPTDPFIGTYDLPLGTRDGSQSVFAADKAGVARFEATFKPCLQLTGEHLAAGLAIAWHSDGKTYGVVPGAFATYSHVHLYAGLPKRGGN